MNEKLTKQSHFSWRDIIVIVGYFVVTFTISLLVNIVVMLVVGFTNNGVMSNPDDFMSTILPTTTAWSLFIGGLINVIGVFLMYWQFIKDSWVRFWQSWKKNIPIIIAGYIVVMLFMYLFDTYVSSETSANQTLIEETLNNLSVFEMILMQISMVFFAPIVEEFLCRKAMFGSYKHIKIVNILLFIASSVFFGLLHYGFDGNFLVLIPYMFMGMAMATVYWLTDNIFTSIGLHFMNNGIATLLLLLSQLMG